MLAKLTMIYRDAKGRFQKVSKAMSEAWTEKGDGTEYPEGADTSVHSGDYEAQHQTSEMDLEKPVDIPSHDHAWTKGVTPAGEVRICKICGLTEKV